jgi:hypothetical protein
MTPATKGKTSSRQTATPVAVLMLLSNAYDPDPRVRREAL